MRNLGKGDVPAAMAVPNVRTLQEMQLTGELVQIDAEVIGTQVSTGEFSAVLWDKERSFRAILKISNPAAVLARCSAGARLKVTGAVQILSGGHHAAPEVVVWLRSADDLQVLEEPWSTNQRAAMYLASGLGLGLVCAGLPLLWVRRRARLRVERTSEENERHASLDPASSDALAQYCQGSDEQ